MKKKKEKTTKVWIIVDEHDSPYVKWNSCELCVYRRRMEALQEKGDRTDMFIKRIEITIL